MEPLPPIKEVEYRCIVGRMIDDMTGLEYSTFSFETAKEFSSFRYEIAVRYKVEPGNLVFRVLGMTATRMMMPAFGTAKSLLKVPTLPLGKYTVTILKSDGSENVFYIEHTKKGFQILKPIPRKRFIDLVVSKEAAMQGKITSTVSKAPPAPLIPRTIQKRTPAPPTPEELEILEALKTETPEERDAREEAELFGSAPRKKATTNGKGAAAKKKSAKEAKPKNGKAKAKARPAAKNNHKKAAKPAKKAKPAAKKKKH